MSKAQGLHRYLRTISRKLACYKDTKQTLLEGLEQELSVYSSLSYDELCQEIGVLFCARAICYAWRFLCTRT